MQQLHNTMISFRSQTVKNQGQEIATKNPIFFTIDTHTH